MQGSQQQGELVLGKRGCRICNWTHEMRSSCAGKLDNELLEAEEETEGKKASWNWIAIPLPVLLRTCLDAICSRSTPLSTQEN
jgi:hypothetical protein